MEIAILLGLLLAVIGVGIVSRLRRSRRRKARPHTDTIYPLW
ncbi:MAG: hypothetical protein ACREE2_08275 [Stellaceae bacterium]